VLNPAYRTLILKRMGIVREDGALTFA